MPGADAGKKEVADAEPHREHLQIFGKTIRIRHRSSVVQSLLAAALGHFDAASPGQPPDLDYEVTGGDPEFRVARNGAHLGAATRPDRLLHLLEKDITVELQKQRSDLYFLHAAAVAWRGRAYLLAADAGSGKSTTTWALLHHGFAYLSDELGPIDLRTMTVVPYPHALCLKAVPPAPYALPAQAMHLGRTMHIPADALPAEVVGKPCPLAGVFLVGYAAEAAVPSVTRVSAAEGAARIYVTVLNALAHEDAGLAPALQIASRVPCFALTTAGLTETSQLVRETIERDAP